jgi:hypothetical protein
MMSHAASEIVIPALGMVGLFAVLVACLPVASMVLNARDRAALVAAATPGPVRALRGWTAPTHLVTRSAYRPTRRARRHHLGTHRLSGLAPGQRYAPTLNTVHQIRRHAA